MDHLCRDIPMKLDIRRQPLDFSIYLHQVIEVPQTSAGEPAYNFQCEIKALETVNQIIENNIKRQQEQQTASSEPTQQSDPVADPNDLSPLASQSSRLPNTEQPPFHIPLTSLEPIRRQQTQEAPLTPIKSDFLDNKSRPADPSNISVPTQDEAPANNINPSDFEDIHYDPFDHFELQTIDERRELDLVFRASYADQALKNQQESINKS